MKTYEIDRKEIKNLTPVAEGYKAIKYDGGVMQGDFKYCGKDEDICGKVFKVDGDISACNWGLHFSKDPANVFDFCEPLGYSRYFKVKAYDKLNDDKGNKSVTNVLEFVEEYNLMEFIEIIKEFDRKSFYSDGYGISNGCGISNGSGISNGYGISDGYGICDGYGINSGYGISDGYGISYGFGLRRCEAVKNCIFCCDKEAIKNYIFNKKVSEDRFYEVFAKLKSFAWHPVWHNMYDLKGNKKWRAVCFPELTEVDNKTAWSKMPKEMLDYIVSLPEFDAKVFKKITEIEVEQCEK